MRLNHRLIETFRTVVISGSASNAAKTLFTSQPAVSRDLARLEQVLGFSLFERGKGRLLPSAQGTAFYEEVERSFTGLIELAERADALRLLKTGTLSIAALPALCDSLLPQACERFHLKHPEVLIRISALDSPELDYALSAQRFDLGLVEHKHTIPQTTAIPLFKGNEVVIMAPSHALAHKKRLKLQDLSHQAMVGYSAKDPYRRRLDVLLDQYGVRCQIVAETSSSTSMCALVRSGIGLAVVNPLTPRFTNNTDLVCASLSPSIVYEVDAVQPINRPRNPLTGPLLADLRRCLKIS
jgi:DNA-binding transcriptional LysR family regulator